MTSTLGRNVCADIRNGLFHDLVPSSLVFNVRKGLRDDITESVRKAVDKKLNYLSCTFYDNLTSGWA